MESDRKLVAKLAKDLYDGKITFDEFLLKVPGENTDEDISDLIYLITHEPKKGGFMGVKPEEHDTYFKEISNLVEKLSK